MSLIFHNGRFVPEHSIQKLDAEARVLRRLRDFLDANEPSLARFLVNTWRSQGNAITYKELREAILNGDITTDILDDWMQDYSRFVVKHLQPAWEMAIAAGAEEKEQQYPGWFFDPMGDSVRSWTQSHAAEFVTNVTTTQIDALRAVVRKAAVLEDMSVDELARVIRPMVGLTKDQTTANMNYYKRLRANGISPKRAQESAQRYAARQHRYRGYNIARTELATAYNTGAYEGTKQAQAAGLMGKTKKIWCTAMDERVCPICGSLENVEFAMDDDIFYEVKNKDGNKISRRINPKLTDPNRGKIPPAHPGCRCAIIYEEVEPPKKIT